MAQYLLLMWEITNKMKNKIVNLLYKLWVWSITPGDDIASFVNSIRVFSVYDKIFEEKGLRAAMKAHEDYENWIKRQAIHGLEHDYHVRTWKRYQEELEYILLEEEIKNRQDAHVTAWRKWKYKDLYKGYTVTVDGEPFEVTGSTLTTLTLRGKELSEGDNFHLEEKITLNDA